MLNELHSIIFFVILSAAYLRLVSDWSRCSRSIRKCFNLLAPSSFLLQIKKRRRQSHVSRRLLPKRRDSDSIDNFVFSKIMTSPVSHMQMAGINTWNLYLLWAVGVPAMAAACSDDVQNVPDVPDMPDMTDMPDASHPYSSVIPILAPPRDGSRDA